MKNPRESNDKLPGVNAGVSYEEIEYVQILLSNPLAKTMLKYWSPENFNLYGLDIK